MTTEVNMVLSDEQIEPLEIAADKWIKGLRRNPRINKELISAIPALCQTVRSAWAANQQIIEVVEDLNRQVAELQSRLAEVEQERDLPQQAISTALPK